MTDNNIGMTRFAHNAILIGTTGIAIDVTRSTHVFCGLRSDTMVIAVKTAHVADFLIQKTGLALAMSAGISGI